MLYWVLIIRLSSSFSSPSLKELVSVFVLVAINRSQSPLIEESRVSIDLVDEGFNISDSQSVGFNILDSQSVGFNQLRDRAISGVSSLSSDSTSLLSPPIWVSSIVEVAKLRSEKWKSLTEEVSCSTLCFFPRLHGYLSIVI
ncbi:Uncharacterized protein Rs2_32342 [Raphanus sativus]|nr:Uncharacterized protein Rs2_32338 [Raphanus sativus]KAJ4882249.1 Uncharacterized protein Rs2_32342 [Raphanus sativus]